MKKLSRYARLISPRKVVFRGHRNTIHSSHSASDQGLLTRDIALEARPVSDTMHIKQSFGPKVEEWIAPAASTKPQALNHVFKITHKPTFNLHILSNLSAQANLFDSETASTASSASPVPVQVNKAVDTNHYSEQVEQALTIKKRRKAGRKLSYKVVALPPPDLRLLETESIEAKLKEGASLWASSSGIAGKMTDFAKYVCLSVIEGASAGATAGFKLGYQYKDTLEAQANEVGLAPSQTLAGTIQNHLASTAMATNAVGALSAISPTVRNSVEATVKLSGDAVSKAGQATRKLATLGEQPARLTNQIGEGIAKTGAYVGSNFSSNPAKAVGGFLASSGESMQISSNVVSSAAKVVQSAGNLVDQAGQTIKAHPKMAFAALQVGSTVASTRPGQALLGWLSGAALGAGYGLWSATFHSGWSLPLEEAREQARELATFGVVEWAESLGKLGSTRAPDVSMSFYSQPSNEAFQSASGSPLSFGQNLLTRVFG